MPRDIWAARPEIHLGPMLNWLSQRPLLTCVLVEFVLCWMNFPVQLYYVYFILLFFPLQILQDTNAVLLAGSHVCKYFELSLKYNSLEMIKLWALNIAGCI